MRLLMGHNFLDMDKKKKQNRFIERSKLKHGDKYDYSLVDYIDRYTDIDILCPIHGMFKQKPINHFAGCGCQKCGGTQQLINKDFINKAIKIHGENKYDYTKTFYLNNRSKVEIYCKKCRKYFDITPNDLLGGHGCKKCGYEKVSQNKRLGLVKFIDRSKKLYGNRYIYDKVVYKNTDTDVLVYCTVCNKYFKTTPHRFLKGSSCPQCFGTPKKTTEQFILDAKNVHGDKYDYSLVEYITALDKVKIICPTHGIFEQVASDHLYGHGCFKCRKSIGEKSIQDFLYSIKIEHETQLRVNVSKYNYIKKTFIFDFFISDFKGKKYVIEYNGVQHYEHCSFFHKNGWSLEKQQQRDADLRDYCSRNDIILIEIPYWDYDNIEEILNKWFKIIKT